jgi:aminoglycoside 6'-N-acetyltransferase I
MAWVARESHLPMADFQIRLAELSDIPQLSRLREALWPESSAEEHAGELAQIVAGKIPAILPMVIFVAAAPAGALLGFLEVGMRSHADGCDWSHAVGYVEGWFVLENARRRGIGAALLRAAEDWSRAQGCKEIASDTQIDNGVSQSAHRALGFEVAERAVLFRKAL